MDKGQDFFQYMQKATVAVCTVRETKNRLKQAGFEELPLTEEWRLQAGGSYYTQTSPSMLLAFQTAAAGNYEGLRIIGAHTDNPALKLKPAPEVDNDGYRRLNIEIYGGPIFYTWFDRPLSIAGTVALRSDRPLVPELRIVDLQKPVVTLPSLAIHMNREVNKGAAISAQKEMLPLVATLKAGMEKENYLLRLLADELKVELAAILDFDLFVYCAEAGQLVGVDEEFISCPRIDDTAMVYAAMQALIAGTPQTGVNAALFVDHEEIGSLSRQGADSMNFKLLLEKLRRGLGIEKAVWTDCLLRSFFISADGAHACHPAYPEKCDPTNRPKINGGLVIKQSGNKAYASEAFSTAAWQQVCERAQVPYQKFVNHADIPGGKTIGSLISRYLPIPIVDTGLAMLAMHSARELAGWQDMEDMIQAMTAFYSL